MATVEEKSVTIIWAENWFGVASWFVQCNTSIGFENFIEFSFVFQELLGFSLPLINYHYLKRKCRNAVDYLVNGNAPDVIKNTPILTLDTKCAYCDERPTIPYHMDCSHIFCYYCLKVNNIKYLTLFKTFS